MDGQFVTQGDPDVDVDPGDGRQETSNQRLDRNWNELLQELRVTQTGTQILTGFLLSIAFQPVFAELDSFQHTVYLVLVMVAVITTALGLAPVNLHRGLFRRHAMGQLVAAAHLIVRIVLGGVGLVLVGTVLLVFDVVVDRAVAVVAASAMALVVIVLGLIPRIVRSRASKTPR